MTKKCYAHIKTSQEVSEAIKTLTDEVLAPGGLTKAYNAIKEIAKLNNKFHSQFKDTNPDWMPDNTNNQIYAKYQRQAAIQYYQQNYQNSQATPTPQPAQPPVPIYAYELEADDTFKA